MGGSVSWDGILVAGGITAFVALVALYLTPGAGSRLFDRVLRACFEYRDIMKNVDGSAELYLRRFFITPRKWLGGEHGSKWPRVLGWVPERFRKIFVHHILLSDDRTPHDHPWDFTSILLGGMYVEHIGTEDKARRLASFGSVLRNRATHIHRLEIVRPVWSLVFAGPSYRLWGFWPTYPDGTRWVSWRSFLGCYHEASAPEDEIDNRRFNEASWQDGLDRCKSPPEISIPIFVDEDEITRKVVSVGPKDLESDRDDRHGGEE